jgi:hypothetical protein
MAEILRVSLFCESLSEVFVKQHGLDPSRGVADRGITRWW